MDHSLEECFDFPMFHTERQDGFAMEDFALDVPLDLDALIREPPDDFQLGLDAVDWSAFDEAQGQMRMQAFGTGLNTTRSGSDATTHPTNHGSPFFTR